MTPQRRAKLLLMVAFVVIILFYFSGEARNIRNQGFYQSTVQALEAKKAANNPTENKGLSPVPGQDQKSADDEIARPVPPKKNEAEGSSDQDEEMEEISIAGRTKMKIPKQKSKQEQGDGQKQEQGGDEHGAAKAELNSILKRAPVIIFSKSYCPHSARAKSILVDKYTIIPAPYVVELDQHPMGQELQSLLAESTGRRTVPNVLIGGRSIGGGDDTAALHEQGELAATVKAMGGKWVTEAHE